MAKPNYIIFLTDDQGCGDLSCMGSPTVRTPHIDRLAEEGVRFSDWYANSPVCSPSRAALLTGRYPGNAGVRAILAGHRTASGLPATVPTLAETLKPLGYRAYLAGKWHLGLLPACRPERRGFDHWYGFLAGCVDYYSHIFYWGMNQPGPGINPTHDLWEDGREVWHNGRYLTEAITDKALAYIRQAAAEGSPFLLYVAYNAPHYPMHAPAEYMARHAGLPWAQQVMAAMLSAVDDGVGAIMAEVQRLGLAGSTCTCFSSDNGPSRESRNWLDGTLDPYYGGSAGALKGHKFSLYEGGIRVPGILHWPGTIPGGRVLSAPCAMMDIFPTLLAAAGGSPADYALDGRDILPYACGGAEPPERAICWEMNTQTAIRRGPWKLVLNGQLVEGAPPEDAVHLANLADDPGEQVNLLGRYPQTAGDLQHEALAWRAGIERRWREEFALHESGTTGRV